MRQLQRVEGMLRLGFVAPGRSCNLLLLSTEMHRAQLPLVSSLHMVRAALVIAPRVDVLDKMLSKAAVLRGPLSLKGSIVGGLYDRSRKPISS